MAERVGYRLGRHAELGGASSAGVLATLLVQQHPGVSAVGAGLALLPFSLGTALGVAALLVAAAGSDDGTATAWVVAAAVAGITAGLTAVGRGARAAGSTPAG